MYDINNTVLYTYLRNLVRNWDKSSSTDHKKCLVLENLP